MTNLTERYIYAATRSVPEKSRDDLRAELEASIADAIDARVDEGESRDAAERVVLTDLGDPDRLAADYSDRPAFLIGPRYYFEWLRLLKVLLWIVVPIAAVGITLGEVLSGGDIGEIVAAAIGGLLTVALHVAFWVTLIFAILERTADAAPERRGAAKDALNVTWSLDRLPEPRAKGLGRADLIATLVFLGLAAGAIIWDRFIGLAWIGENSSRVLDPSSWAPIPVLNPDLWPWWIAGLFVLMAAEAALAIAIYVRGRWTWTFAVLNALIAVAVAVPALVLLLTDRLLNPAFLAAFDMVTAEVVGIVTAIVAVVIVGCALADIIDGITKTVRSRVR
ncbi:hypothetical protein ASD65_07940 [Microbacterium sp. Root61]|uniref:permease prefix domain 1-containing protein n=1 Tax=Microbacterium sp. Root61 TaxID=1736570 RepID=UPI000702002A|nr:permease prefix domain 1-containing protein [Microbacterium sp. Root61]KRA24363.1 hypothetical protein ASD65_07940 [Microbacterium sp. Root61]